jgi:hypothetical protein
MTEADFWQGVLVFAAIFCGGAMLASLFYTKAGRMIVGVLGMVAATLLIGLLSQHH